jgi:Outer membrane protein beta-barrel domain
MKLQSALFLLLISIVSNRVGAQTKYGLRVGFSLANQSLKLNPPSFPAQSLESKPLVGFQIGAFIKSKLTSKLKLVTELNYSTIGSRIKYSPTPYVNPDGSIFFLTGSEYYNEKISQIEIPIFLQYNIIEQFYVGIGPIVGIHLSSKVDNFQNSSFKTNYYQPIDLGAGLLAGCNIYKKIDLNLKYNLGLINVNKRDFSTIKNRTFNFSVLYSFK